MRPAIKYLDREERGIIKSNDRDLKSLRARATEEGTPDQTFVTIVLHKYLTDRLADKVIVEK